MITDRTKPLADQRSPEASTAIPSVPLDAECAAGLALASASLPHAFTLEMIPAIRSAITEFELPMTDAEIKGENDDFLIEERMIPGPKGAPDILLLICLPTRSKRPVPVFYHIHGGGMVSGSRRTAIDAAVEPAREFGAAVVSVEYRLAPESPDPAPIEDCYVGLEWIVANARELGIDPTKVILIGPSAGGGLSAGIALLSRDRAGPAVFAQMLIEPMLDDRLQTISALQNDLASPFQMANGTAFGTSHDLTASRTCWTALLGERCGGADVSVYAAPSRADDLSNLPPTFVEVGSAEAFRDEAITFASQIWQAGGQAELHVWSGGHHGYFYYQPGAAISQITRQARHDWLRRLLSNHEHQYDLLPTWP